MTDHAPTTAGTARWELAAAVGPPLLLGGLGLLHPHQLDDGSAGTWTALHVALLPLFPLLALGPWLVARRSSVLLGRVALGLGYVYALFYTALDVLAGIGTGALQQAGEPDGIPVLFDAGNALSLVGVWAYLAATVVAVVAALRQDPRRALVGAVLVLVAAVSFLSSHVYWPVGVLTMLVLAVGWGLLVRRSRGDAAAHGDAYARPRDGSGPVTRPDPHRRPEDGVSTAQGPTATGGPQA